jgi:hypothetical protein
MEGDPTFRLSKTCGSISSIGRREQESHREAVRSLRRGIIFKDKLEKQRSSRTGKKDE